MSIGNDSLLLVNYPSIPDNSINAYNDDSVLSNQIYLDYIYLTRLWNLLIITILWIFLKIFQLTRNKSVQHQTNYGLNTATDDFGKFITI